MDYNKIGAAESGKSFYEIKKRFIRTTTSVFGQAGSSFFISLLRFSLLSIYICIKGHSMLNKRPIFDMMQNEHDKQTRTGVKLCIDAQPIQIIL